MTRRGRKAAFPSLIIPLLLVALLTITTARAESALRLDDPAFYVKKSAWQETLLEALEALKDSEKDPTAVYF